MPGDNADERGATRGRLCIKLTPAQRAELKAVAGRSGVALEFDVAELEARIATSFASLEIPRRAHAPRWAGGEGEWVRLEGGGASEPVDR